MKTSLEAKRSHRGKPTPPHLCYAEDCCKAFLVNFHSAGWEPLDAMRLMSAMLHRSDETSRAQQFQKCAKRSSPGFDGTTRRLRTEVVPIASRARLTREAAGLEQLDISLDRLALASPPIRKYAIEVCVNVIGAQSCIQERDAELLRAIADPSDYQISPSVEIGNSQATGDVP